MPEASGSDVADESDYSIFENKSGLAEDMKFLASMPELCDVTFLVGDTREPICAVKAVLAARSRIFQKMFDQAPSPQRKKEPIKENKFRTFLKRSSEPLLNLQNVTQQRSGYAQQLAPIQEPNQHQTLIIDEFEPDVFRQLIEYIHTGCVTLQPRTLLGLMNAADHYGLEQLRKACTGFVQCCITVDTVCALLASAERYIQYKCTKSLVSKVLEFVNEHGNEVLSLGSFTLLPEHVVRLILGKEELQADEFTKFQAALMWSKKSWDSRENQHIELKHVIGNFLEYIQFHKIPTSVLMKEIYPLNLVPGEIIMTALAYQADPNSVDTGKLSPYRVKHRNLSAQSSLQDQFASNTSLSSNVSVDGSDEKQHSGKHSVTAEQEMREQQQWNRKQRGSEDEDLQRLIEQRTQFQTMRQEEELQRQNEEQQTRKQEEELRKQEMQEEFDRRQKEQQRKKKKEEEQEEKRRKQEEEEGSKVVQDDEETKRQKQEEKLMLQLQLEEVRLKFEERQRREALEKLRQDELMEQRQRSLEKLRQEDETKDRQEDETKVRQEDEIKAQEKENIEQQQQEKNLEEGLQKEEVKMPGEILQQQKKEDQGERATDRQEGKERQAEEESLQPETIKNEEQIQSEETTGEEPREKQESRKEQEESLISREDEQKRIREERKLQLQLQELKVQWSVEQDASQTQEQILQQQIEEKRYEEQMESPQFPQVQLQLEGRKPVPERPEKRQKSGKKSRRRKRVEIRVHEAESPKQETAPAEGVAGLYIKLVVRQDGRAPLVWLFKTHKF